MKLKPSKRVDVQLTYPKTLQLDGSLQSSSSVGRFSPGKIGPLSLAYKVGWACFKKEETLLLSLEIRKTIPWFFYFVL
jgi:hypothetical protein